MWTAALSLMSRIGRAGVPRTRFVSTHYPRMCTCGLVHVLSFMSSVHRASISSLYIEPLYQASISSLYIEPLYVEHTVFGRAYRTAAAVAPHRAPHAGVCVGSVWRLIPCRRWRLPFIGGASRVPHVLLEVAYRWPTGVRASCPSSSLTRASRRSTTSAMSAAAALLGCGSSIASTLC